ncbi:hypothetical protein KQI65_00510 [bacterium]|nr:hypothetical protein [bacterium]
MKHYNMKGVEILNSGLEIRAPRIATSLYYRTTLSILIIHLRTLDNLRMKLERIGGTVRTLEEFHELLRLPVQIASSRGSVQCSLADRDRLRHLLYEIGGGSVHLDIRQSNDSGLPIFFLCRTTPTHITCPVILEEFHASPGYHFTDARFKTLRILGEKQVCLRVARFREKTGDFFGYEFDRANDVLLQDLGVYLLSAMWDELQRPAFILCDALNPALSHFQEATELTSLAWTADPTTLSSRVTPHILRFFRDVYPREAIARFLETLETLSGAHRRKIPARAEKLHFALEESYTTFLETPVPWSSVRSSVPIWKILYANLNRMTTLHGVLQENQPLMEAAAELDSIAEEIIGEFLDSIGSPRPGSTT